MYVARKKNINTNLGKNFQIYTHKTGLKFSKMVRGCIDCLWKRKNVLLLYDLSLKRKKFSLLHDLL